MTDNQKTASGREVKRTGMTDTKMTALQKLKAAREGGIKRTDQYEVNLINFVNTLYYRWKRRKMYSRKSMPKNMTKGKKPEMMMTLSLMMKVSATKTTVARSGKTMMTIKKQPAKKRKNSRKMIKP